MSDRLELSMTRENDDLGDATEITWKTTLMDTETAEEVISMWLLKCVQVHGLNAAALLRNAKSYLNNSDEND